MLNIYLIIPFIFAFLIGNSIFIKNPIYIRKFAKTLFLIQFFISSILFFCTNTYEFSYLNIDFTINKSTQFLLLLVNLIFFLFSIISKTFILKLHKTFYATSFLLLGLINIAICCDNIFIIYLSLFWIFLIFYFLSISFSNKEIHKQINYQLKNNLIWLFISLMLILYEFARYFVVNNIAFSFSNINSNLCKIDDIAIILAFIGFAIIIAKLFNLIPFNGKNLFISNKLNPFIFALNFSSSLIIGSSLFIKTYTNFDYLFYQFQDEIAIFLIINFAIFIILALRQKNLFKFLTNAFCAIIIIILFSIFSFEQECINAFLYSIFALCISYCLSAIVFMIIIDKFKTDNLDDFKKIDDKTKFSQLFITFSLLNIAGVPLLSIFGFELICFMLIFSTDYESLILNFIPYCLILGALILSLTSFGILYKILIEPVEKIKTQITYSNHQIIVCTILIFIIFVLGVYPEYIFKQINTLVQLGKF